MAIQKTEAIVLRIRNFRETSLLVNLFTKDFGKLSGLIKGIRKEPQRYGGLPLVFSHNLVVFYEQLKKDLNLVTQCDAREQFLPLRANLEKTNYANYFMELLDAVTEEYDKNEQLFELIVNSLEALCRNSQSWQIARIFEIRLLNLSGFKPRLDACVNCQKEFPSPFPSPQRGESGVRGWFSSILGGILCPSCLAFDRSANPVLRGTLASIDYIEKSNWQQALHLKISRNIARELAVILDSFLDIHLDKKINSRKFLI